MRLGCALGACALAVLGISILKTPPGHAGVVRYRSARAVLSALPKQQLANTLANLPWAFEPNVGQADAEVKFIARANDATVFLTRR
ncbi:MAG TPA: hypothetical protein VKT50_02980, partial [Candidatus Acidoferrales bacterium]|nr:hypothetical protein [Candidatus Acidoferrales bacterium]